MTDTVLKQLSALAVMDIDALKAMWKDLYKDIEPPKSNRIFLIRRLSYRIQEIAYGGLSHETKNKIKKLQRNPSAGSMARNRDLPPPGTVLTREYQGVEHRVTVLHDGFEYQERRYSNLSIIARVITGTRWSGPVFFGLKREA